MNRFSYQLYEMSHLAVAPARASPTCAVTRLGKYSQYPGERSGTRADFSNLSRSSFIRSPNMTTGHGKSFACFGMVKIHKVRRSPTRIWEPSPTCSRHSNG